MNAPLDHNALASPVAEAYAYPVQGGLVSPSAGSALLRAKAISIICNNAIFRTCLARCLNTMTAEFSADAYATITEWQAGHGGAEPGVILLYSTGDRAAEAGLKDDIGAILGVAPEAKILVLSEAEHPSLIRTALAAGSRGVASMNTELNILVGAVRLVVVGGTFVPASSLLSVASSEPETEASPGDSFFSRRQLDVLDYLREGNPNKIIAFKLKMSEATVKVHVRNMMRKLNARNRTELIFKSHSLPMAA